MFDIWHDENIWKLGRKIVSIILLEDIEHAEILIWTAIVFLTGLIFYQTYAFARPCPVPSKILPRRPGLQILFKQDDEIENVLYGDGEKSGSSDGFNIYDTLNANLPDSFAPLLSSSTMEIVQNDISTDLMHAFELIGDATFKKGQHVIPLNKDASRPQLTLDLDKNPKKSVSKMNTESSQNDFKYKMKFHCLIGSDGFTSQEDFVVNIPTTSRSQPMLKSAKICLEPPLPLLNVAPTLIHIPTLFQDNSIPFLTRRLAVRLVINLFSSFSDLLERFLWFIESNCKIHLSTVYFTPMYNGRASERANNPTTDYDENLSIHLNDGPQWTIRLSFSGKVLLFDFIPIPFFFITLPTFIIPSPHALLHKLLTKQPLASGIINHENINEDKIILAVTDAIHMWNINLKTLFTPPAVGVDLTLPGGLSVAVETMLGRDLNPSCNMKSNINTFKNHASSSSKYSYTETSLPASAIQTNSNFPHSNSDNSLSTWNSNLDELGTNFTQHLRSRKQRKSSFSNHTQTSFSNHTHTNPTNTYDANNTLPWYISVSVGGEIQRDKIVLNLEKASAVHHHPSTKEINDDVQSHQSQIVLSGDLIITKVKTNIMNGTLTNDLITNTNKNFKNMDPPSVASMLLFPQKYLISSRTSSLGKKNTNDHMLMYDYAFEIDEHSRIDSISLSIGASHPMLNGGTMISTILESIYAYGYIGARENSTLNPYEKKRKRNILRHLPAVDFTCGIQNLFIPEESNSYSDDGQNICLPQLKGGRMTIRVLGGLDKSAERNIEKEKTDGIKIIADFGVTSFTFNNECPINEFPELDIQEGTTQQSLLSGTFGGRLSGHLRPQAIDLKNTSKRSGIGPNVLNPLEAFEIDFSGTNILLKMKEASVTIGHRRVIFPSESTFSVNTVESVLDMAFEGKSHCEFCWDFQGSSPILQVTEIANVSPAEVSHEYKKQVSLLISALRQGRVSFHISSVGGIKITKAATTREHKEGLYDWKFFNALVSPDQEGASRLVDILHDKPTMQKLVHVSKLINKELGNLFDYALKHVWRAKEIFDQEEILEASQVIPGHKMARLASLFLSGNLSKEKDIFPIIDRVTKGEGLDIVKMKELLRDNLTAYDKWAPEIDRAVRWLGVLLGPMPSSQPYVENHVLPLSELSIYSSKLIGIPSAKILYDTINDKKHIPLDPHFSNLVSWIAPYMSFKQVEYMLLARPASDWQHMDLRRLRYVYSLKKKVLDISESYGGLSFVPQSFLVSVFVAEATRKSLKARGMQPTKKLEQTLTNTSIFTTLRRRHQISMRQQNDDFVLSPAGKIASQQDFSIRSSNNNTSAVDAYDPGDSLLGPQDVAILLQAGLASSNKESTVVQLNQRMLLDLIASQPKNFAIGVLCELGNPGGHGSPRGLASALMSLLEINQSSFKVAHRLDIHALLSSWTGIKIPMRDWYLAGGRWARQSYYDALYTVAKSILEDGEVYLALKGHVQRVRHNDESDPLPLAKELEFKASVGLDYDNDTSKTETKLTQAINNAKSKIDIADKKGLEAVEDLTRNKTTTSKSNLCKLATDLYWEAFEACQKVLQIDKHSFQTDWFKLFYRRNYDALMVKSVFDNVMEDMDQVQEWLEALRNCRNSKNESQLKESKSQLFFQADIEREQELIDGIIDVIFYDEKEREFIRKDPIVRLLISNREGKYNFSIISAMGVITDGKQGQELASTMERILKKRGVVTIRADTGTARSLEFNASKIEEAIETAVQIGKPYGLLGYSQGCANMLTAESLLLSGPPTRQKLLTNNNHGLVCRQLLFSAANSSMHGGSSDAKAQKLFVMCEEAFKYQQGYFSRAFISWVLETLNGVMDSAGFHKFIGGAQSLMPEGARAFWRESQHLSHVPTCVLRGVMEAHTTPECLEMISNLLTKQSGSELHDSQVHVYDAVGHPIYTINRNGLLLKDCDMGGSIQSTHHWSPLDNEVEFLRTKRDILYASFDCAKDRHVFPWVDVNVRFGFIKYVDEISNDCQDTK